MYQAEVSNDLIPIEIDDAVKISTAVSARYTPHAATPGQIHAAWRRPPVASSQITPSQRPARSRLIDRRTGKPTTDVSVPENPVRNRTAVTAAPGQRRQTAALSSTAGIASASFGLPVVCELTTKAVTASTPNPIRMRMPARAACRGWLGRGMPGFKGPPAAYHAAPLTDDPA